MRYYKRNALSRRSFVQRCLTTAGATGLGAFGGLSAFQRLAMAGEAAPAGSTKDRYYVFVYFSGGWDILLSLDPRDPNTFHQGNTSITQIQPAYEQLDDPGNDGSLIYTPNGTPLGPYAGPLAAHWDQLAIVRGMSMETLTHEVGRRRFLTGKPPTGLLARGSSAATWFASQLGSEQAIPNLSVRVETYNVDQPNYATGLKVASVPDLVRSLKTSDPALDPKLDMLIDQMLAQSAECGLAQGSPTWQKAEGSRGKAREMVSSGFDALFDFQAKTDAMAQVRQHYGIGASGSAALQTPEAQAAMAATALKSGISRCVSFTGASGLDTHYDDWQTDQGPTQERGYNAVARLAEDLAATEYKGTGASWLDHTVIVGFSEFSRTPMLNARTGRDHHLNNACFLLGGPVKGQTIVGASTDVGMQPGAVDLATGLPTKDPEAEILKPEHVIQGMFDELGVEGDPADLRVDPLTALFS
ncbi:MAG: hypothetical protein ACI9WU_004421 [Myxococcota bacterium]|jgi:hypothetical protein